MITLILGGARSGKSAHAQALAAASELPVTVIATAQARDAEMAARIARHRAERPAGWITLEEPLHLAAALESISGLALVDCLTLWLLNLLEAGEEVFERERALLLQALERRQQPTLLVANEVGLGVIPMGALTRRYVDEAGRLNQAVAQRADQVLFIAAGLPLTLKMT